VAEWLEHSSPAPKVQDSRQLVGRIFPKLSLFTQHGMSTRVSSELGEMKRSSTSVTPLPVQVKIGILTATSPHGHWIRNSLDL